VEKSISAWRAALRDETQDRARWQLLLRASDLLATARDASEAADALLQTMAELMAVQDACVIDLGQDAARIGASFGQAKPRGASVIGARQWPVVLSGAALNFRTERSDGAVWCLSDGLQRASELHLPLRWCSRVLGIVVLRVPTGREPDKDDIAVLCALASYLTTTLMHSQGASSESLARAGKSKRRSRERARIDLLSPRERQVLALLPRGYSNADLGRELGIAAGTAKIHVERILRKLECRDRTQAAVLASLAGAAI
jgi:DNA-binding CsgD family transcriptional regulator